MGRSGIGGIAMSVKLEALQHWRKALVASIRADGPDLSGRQLAILLSVYLTPPPHTVRGFAAQLSISKPAVTRAIDKLCELGFVKRKKDPDDGRNVLVQRTVKGSVHLTEFAQMVIDAGWTAEPPPGIFDDEDVAPETAAATA